MSDPASPAIWPCGLRESHGGPDHPDFSSHLARCLVCRTDWKNRSGDSGPGLLPSKPLAWTRALVEANRRVKQPVPKAPTDDAAALPTPVAPGFVLGQPIRRTQHTQVFNANQVDLDRPVVVKFITCPPSVINFQLLAREGTILASLKHPHIVTIHQTGRWAEGLWLALEYCPKGSLALLLAGGLQADPLTVAGWVRKVAGAVHAAHRLGLLHNDIKPGNILLDDDGEPKLSDFGLAKKPEDLKRDLARGILAGTPDYMAPEQARGGLADTRSDVHGLGAVLYHLLTGIPPFSGDNHHQILVQVVHAQPEDPRRLNQAVPSDLAAICMKCLAKDPEARYQTAEALAEDLIRFQAGFPVLARKTSRWESTRKWAARNKATALAGSLTIFMLLFSISLLAFLVVMVGREKQNAIKNAELIGSYLDQAEAQAYSSGVQAAAFEMESGATAAATQALEILPFSQRHWEHHYITGRLLQNQVTLRGHGGPVLGFAIHPDGSEWVSVSEDRTVRLWDGATGSQRKNLSGGKHPFVGTCYSADGRRVAVLDATNTARVLDLASGKWSPGLPLSIPALDNDGQPKCPMALSPDGRRLLTAGSSLQIEEREVDSGTRLRVFPKEHSRKINSMAMDIASKRLVTAGDDGLLVIWDLATGNPAKRFQAHAKPILDVAFSPDGTMLASGGKDKKVRVWDALTWERIFSLDAHKDWVRSVAFSPNSILLASAGDDHTIRVWQARSGVPMRVLRGHSDLVTKVGFFPDGRRLLSTGTDNTLKIWNPHENQGLADLPHPDLVRCMAFSPDGKSIATAADDGCLRIWSTEKRALQHRIATPFKQNHALAFCPNGKMLAVVADNAGISLYDTPSMALAAKFDRLDKGIASVVFSPDGKSLLASGEDGSISRLDLDRLRWSQLIPGGEQRGTPIAISADGKWLATTTGQTTIQVWKTEDWSAHREFKGHAKRVLDLAFSPDGRHLASASSDRTIMVWDMESGGRNSVLEGHLMPVTSVRFSPDGHRLLSASFDRSIRLWDPFRGNAVITLNNHAAGVRQAVFSPDGQWIASAGEDNQVLLYDGSTRMEQYRVGQFKSLSDLTAVVDAHNRSTPSEGATPWTTRQLLGPSTSRGWSIIRDGADYVILDSQANATRQAREQALLATWK